MSIYKEIEEEYALAINFGVAETAEGKAKLVGLILGSKPAANPEVSTNVRLYFNATSGLDGLAEWASAIE